MFKITHHDVDVEFADHPNRFDDEQEAEAHLRTIQARVIEAGKRFGLDVSRAVLDDGWKIKAA